MRLTWRDLGTGRADAADGATIELDGFLTTPLQGARTSH